MKLKNKKIKYLFNIVMIYLLYSCNSYKEAVNLVEGNINSNKPTLVFLHGFNENSMEFQFLSKDLEKDYNIFLLEAPHKISDNRYYWYSLEYDSKNDTWSNKSEALSSIDKVYNLFKGVKNVCLIGHSQGAILATALGIKYPLFFKRVVAINGYVDTNIINQEYKNYSQSKFLLLNSPKDYVIPKKDVHKSFVVLDNFKIPYNYIEHNSSHQLNIKELSQVKNWLNDNVLLWKN